MLWEIEKWQMRKMRALAEALKDLQRMAKCIDSVVESIIAEPVVGR